jgi:WD40-like Beta Propeller Repeat
MERTTYHRGKPVVSSGSKAARFLTMPQTYLVIALSVYSVVRSATSCMNLRGRRCIIPNAGEAPAVPMLESTPMSSTVALLRQDFVILKPAPARAGRRISLMWQSPFRAGALIAALALFSAAGGAAPRIFAPGVISGAANDAAPVFAVDGKTVYFFRSNGSDYNILVSHLRGTRWSNPEVASFSGQWRDLEPSISPDGSFLVFASSRPIDDGGKPLDGIWGGTNHPGKGGNLWRVNRKGAGWSAPVRLSDEINFSSAVFSPAVVADGSIYFMAATGEGGKFQLYFSQLQNGAYQTAKPLAFSSGKFSDVDATVAPDQSFIVFSSNRPPESKTLGLFIAYRRDGAWGEPADLGAEVNNVGDIIEARLGPDGHTLYYSSNYVVPATYPKSGSSARQGLSDMQTWNNGLSNIWTFDLTPWLGDRR